LGVPDDIPAWHELLNTDLAKYGGSDIHNPDPIPSEPGRGHGVRLTLPPLATVWLRPPFHTSTAGRSRSRNGESTIHRGISGPFS
ncbi:alpha amylase C-terminal domain-containing protein, partial [Streptomyces sp. NPDC004532]